ncbi:MAG: molybdate ABC transporter substrate-binding protein [Spirochaetaceae bacterium]|nr:molybdate ABC transporter substrate-binding protein [Spirochaetaceae bacterium]
MGIVMFCSARFDLRLSLVRLAVAAAFLTVTAQSVTASPRKEPPATAQPQVTILVAAAASLKNAYDKDLIPLFTQKHPEIAVEGTYDSSGKLQTQIEAGLEADVFMSAAPAQMNALVGKNLVSQGSVKPLLENRIVLIKTAGSSTPVTGFETVTNAAIIAIGDPASVPAGQYARDIFTNLGIWDAVLAKASLGTNVTEVLNWVGEASADAGVVYATDAASTAKVEVIAEAPPGSLTQKVIYPVGVIAASKHQKEAQLFADFLASEEALAIFQKYGFSKSE